MSKWEKFNYKRIRRLFSKGHRVELLILHLDAFRLYISEVNRVDPYSCVPENSDFTGFYGIHVNKFLFTFSETGSYTNEKSRIKRVALGYRYAKN